jgi:DNA-binding NtrC family response regulator
MSADRASEATIRTDGADGACADPPAAWWAAVVHAPAAGSVGRRIAIGAGVRFGRVAGHDVDAEIEDPRMSRRHATVAPRGPVVELRDEGSSNGTFVNGERVDVHVLAPGDVVRMGNTLVVVGPVAQPPPRVPPGGAPGRPAGAAPAFLDAVAFAERVAATELPVLVLGETGTGKDVLARYLHDRSGRSGPFVALNCAALPAELLESALFGHRRGAVTGATAEVPGFFAEAAGGTLFLDEIGELPLHQQSKLLRVLESREVVPLGGSRAVRSDARVIAATNLDLGAALTAGTFRNDLYARLEGAVVRLPPLRERRVDILPLAERFLADRAPGGRFTFSTQAAERLLLYPWPRNVRELQAAMLRLATLEPGGAAVSARSLAMVLADGVAARATPPSPSRRTRSQAPDRDELLGRLGDAGGNVHKLAEHYGKDPRQIYRWLRHHDLDPDDFR